MPSSQFKRSGFTLAEVLVGVLLLGLTATLLGRAVSDGLRAMEQTRLESPNETTMQQVRSTVLSLTTRAQIEAGGELQVPIIQGAERSGEKPETVMLRVRWEAEILPTRLLNVYQIDLEVDIQGGGNEAAKVESKLIAYRTGWGAPEELEALLGAKEDEFKERLSARGETSEEAEL